MAVLVHEKSIFPKIKIADFLRKTALGAAGVVPGMQGAREMYEMQQGFIMTNRMELAFKGLPKRSFQYSL